MSSTELLKAVINKYELDEPVPTDARLAMEKSRRENLVTILKKDAGNIIFISAVVTFFLWIKKFGISLSIAKSAAVLTAAAIIGGSVITVAGVYTARKVIRHVSSEKYKVENPAAVNTVQEKKSDEATQEVLHYSVAVEPVEIDDPANRRHQEYTQKIIQKLRNIHGPKAALGINKLDQFHKADKILSVSIIRLKDKSDSDPSKSIYRVSAKIINYSNSQVLLHLSVIADGESSIPDSLSQLAEKISSKFSFRN